MLLDSRDELELQIKPNSAVLRKNLTLSRGRSFAPISVSVETLMNLYLKSDMPKKVKAEIAEAQSMSSPDGQSVTIEPSSLRGHRRAPRTTQFRILSGRAFKNMYRDPALLTAHYAASIVVASMCCHVE